MALPKTLWPRLRGLYAIVDPHACMGRDTLSVVDAVLGGGCAVMQLRVKASGHDALSDGELLILARKIAQRCRARGVPFVVNDRVDVALLCDADGVHLGQNDLPISDVRALAPRLAYGLSTHTPAQATHAVEQGATLIGYGPIFPTRTKARPAPVVGVDALTEVVQAVRVPVVAIGGITLESLDPVLASGAPLVCAMGAVLGADDPELAARTMHERILYWPEPPTS